MRFIELYSGLQTPVNNEEYLLLQKIQEEMSVAKSILNEREQEVARLLTSRGLLKRFKLDNTLHFKVNF
ncbi:MAG: hypothetical protein HC836_31815 [Richelia sp. RM2_1_2]|nr:hypothetical protein [Richelia sp. RM2_1_2]